MWRNNEKLERVCGRVFLVIFLLSLPLVWLRLFIGGKTDAFEDESRYAKRMPEINAKDIWLGNFQEDLEKSLADQMPASESARKATMTFDGAIFDNLSWLAARKGSNYHLVANKVYAYKDYDYLLRPKLPASQTNFKNDDSEESREIRRIAETSSEYYNNLTIRNKYYYDITNDQAFDFDHPSNDYMDLRASYYPEFMQSRLEIPDFNTYTKYYMKNDHHWNYEGAYQGYKDIIRLMLGDNEELLKPAEKVVFNYNAQGSKSKTAHFYKYVEKFTAYHFELREHETFVNGDKHEYGNQTEYFEDNNLRNGTGDITYGDFYGLDTAVIHYDYKQPEKSNLIMIGFSDSNAINALVASHFNKTWVIDPRFCSRNEFEQIVSKNSVDYLLLLPNTSSIIPKLVEQPRGYDDAV
jgi:hypothetical protein